MKKDYIVTFITEITVMIASILVYRFAAVIFLGDGFSEYALSKRVLATVQTAITMGMGVAVPRYIAMSRANGDSHKESGYFIGGSVLVIGLSALVCIAVILFSKHFAILLFGNAEYSYLTVPIIVVSLGTMLHGLCYSYYRGCLKMNMANLIQAINLGIIPLLAFIKCNGSLANVLYLSGLFSILVSLMFITHILLKITFANIELKQSIRELLSYGYGRVVGDISLSVLISLPAYIVAHQAGVREAGYIAFGISLLNMIAALFAPIGLVLLPSATTMIISSDYTRLRRHTVHILKYALIVTSTIVFIYELFASQIIDLYLGVGHIGIVPVSRILVIGAISYAIYVSMRSIVDAYYKIAVNTINIVISAMFYIIASLAIWLSGYNNYYYYAGLMVVSVTVLAIITLISVHKIFASFSLISSTTLSPLTTLEEV